MAVELEILHPRKEESCYLYRVRNAANVRRGWLTYEIYPQKPESRTLLLIKGSEGLLEGKNLQEYAGFRDHLQREASGRVRSAKNIVNKLADGDISLPNVRVAIHRFGAVPVYVPPFEYKTEFDSDELVIQLALYPSLRKKHTRREGRAEFLSNQTEFVKALGLETSRLMQRYLEDVGECFYDIEYHLDLAGVFERAMEAERLLAESIKSKLEASLPSRASLLALDRGQVTDPFQRVSCQFFKEKTDTLLSARYARNFALYFLNELYKIVGISSRSEKYLNEFSAIRKEFDSRKGEGYYEEATRDNLDDIRTLRRALQAYHRKDYDQLNGIASDVPWVDRFIEFSQFISGLHKFTADFGLSPEMARIFISHQHEVPVAELLREQIEDWSRAGDQIWTKVLFFKSPAGPGIRSAIRRLIWMADSVNAVTPEKPFPIYGGAEKNYSWIGIEAEHGLLLRKRLLFFVEDGADVNKVQADFRGLSLNDLLAPRASIRFEDRIEGLINALRDNVFANFDVQRFSQSSESLDARALEALKAGTKEALLRRAESIIIGFLGQFTSPVQLTVSRMNRLATYPQMRPKVWFARKLVMQYPSSYNDEKSASLSVTRAWEQIKKRNLRIRDKEHRPLGLYKQRYYSGHLAMMASELLPSTQQEGVDVIVNRVLSAIDPEVDI